MYNAKELNFPAVYCLPTCKYMVVILKDMVLGSGKEALEIDFAKCS